MKTHSRMASLILVLGLSLFLYGCPDKKSTKKGGTAMKSIYGTPSSKPYKSKLVKPWESEEPLNPGPLQLPESPPVPSSITLESNPVPIGHPSCSFSGPWPPWWGRGGIGIHCITNGVSDFSLGYFGFIVLPWCEGKLLLLQHPKDSQWNQVCMDI